MPKGAGFSASGTVIGVKRLQARIKAIRDLPRVLAKDPRLQETIVERTKDRFRTKKAPDGSRWKALKKGRWPRHNPNRSDILVDTGSLRDSIGLTGRRGTSTGFGFRVGTTDKDQAGKLALHQLGGRSALTGGVVPARPILGISKEDVTIIERLTKRIAKERIARA